MGLFGLPDFRIVDVEREEDPGVLTRERDQTTFDAAFGEKRAFPGTTTGFRR